MRASAVGTTGGGLSAVRPGHLHTDSSDTTRFHFRVTAELAERTASLPLLCIGELVLGEW